MRGGSPAAAPASPPFLDTSSITLTASSTANRLLVLVSVGRTQGAVADFKTMHLHNTGIHATNAQASGQANDGLQMQAWITPADTAAQTYRLRMGSSAFSYYINADSGGTAKMGGTLQTRMTILEIESP